MKIIIDARQSGTTTGRYIDKLVKNLATLKLKDAFTILTKSERLDFMRQAAPGFEVVASDFAEFGWAEQTGFLKQLNSLGADLVHFGMTQQPVRYHGKAVTTIHDLTTARFTNPSKNWLVFKFKQLVYRWLIKRVAKRSARIIAISQFVKDDLVRFSGINPAKITVIYEAADKISQPPEAITGIKPGKFIMYVGRPLPHKNLQRLIDAFTKLQASRPDLQLVLAGKSDPLYERFEKQVRRRGLANIIFTGFISEGQLRWLYENTAAYVFPSLSEGFGLPGLEAMAHGAPVVCSQATCLPEIYGDAAHYFNPLDTSDIAAKINDVISDQGLRNSLVSKGVAQVAKYSWRRTAEQTAEVYKQVVS